MADYRDLLRLLQKEIKKQEKLIELLSQERSAIVKLNQEQIEKLRERKDEVISEAQIIERERGEVVKELSRAWHGKGAVKFSALLDHCPPGDVRTELAMTGEELKTVASSAQELNDHNSKLIKQTLGMIASTISILRSSPGTELPTYSPKGKLKTTEDPAFEKRSGSVVREA